MNQAVKTKEPSIGHYHLPVSSLQGRIGGFTLIELLVVISIIGLLAAVVLVSLNSARAKSRDARRLSDMHQMQTALELFYNDAGGYPPTNAAATTGISAGNPFAGAVKCSANTFLSKIPTNPSPGGANYVYAQGATTASVTACGAALTVSTDYTITFSTEGATGGLASGAHTASSGGIQ